MPRTLARTHVEVRRFEEEDEPGVLDLLRAAFGTGIGGAAPASWRGTSASVDGSEFFRWKHRVGPFGRSTGVVAVVNERIVGFVAWLPWLLRAGTQTLRTTRVVDFAVHPKHRGRGVGTALIREGRACLPDDDFAFEWAKPNELSYPRAVKLGHTDVGRPRRFVGLLPLPRLGTVLRASGRGSSAARRPARVEAPTAARMLGDGAVRRLLPTQLESLSPRLATAVDMRYLSWRYGRFEEYRAVRTGDDGASGIAIFTVCSGRRFRVAHVCELLLSAPDDYRAMRRLLKRVRRAAPVDFVSYAFPSRHDARRCGFVQVGDGPVLTVGAIHKHLAPDPRQSASWTLSLGDLEMG